VLKTSELKGKKIGFTLEHADETHNVESLHKWNVALDVQTSTKSSWFKVTGKVQRNSKDDEEDWKVRSRDRMFINLNVFLNLNNILIG